MIIHDLISDTINRSFLSLKLGTETWHQLFLLVIVHLKII